jgi:hypothetical protein
MAKSARGMRMAKIIVSVSSGKLVDLPVRRCKSALIVIAQSNDSLPNNNAMVKERQSKRVSADIPIAQKGRVK